MNRSINCPRCQQALLPDDDVPEILCCEQCGGNFVPASLVNSDLTVEQSANKQSADNDPPVENSHSTINCPECVDPMETVQFHTAVLFRCSACAGIWADAVDADGDTDSQNDATSENDTTENQTGNKTPSPSVSRYLLYAMTLPERTLRSTVGVTAGAAKEAAQFLVPSAFQTSKTYEVAVKNSLKFLTEDIGGVAAESDVPELGKDFAARKAVGNFVDLAGWATLAFSPVWVLAIMSDVAYGSKSYLHELAAELKEKGLIDEHSTIDNIDDVLAAVQEASGKAASFVDTPPLSIEQLKKSVDETRQAIASTDYTAVLPEAELKRYWTEMREISKRENVSLIGVSGALTMHTLEKVGGFSRGAITGVQVAGGLFNKHVFGHYVDSLKTMNDRGFYQTVRESSEPYVEAVWNNFAQNHSTWTEEVVTGRAVCRLFRMVTGFFSRSKSSDAKSTDAAGDKS